MNAQTIPAPTGTDYYMAEVEHEALALRLRDEGDVAGAERHWVQMERCNRMWWTAEDGSLEVAEWAVPTRRPDSGYDMRGTE